MSLDDIMRELRRDLPYYVASGGGVTLSGGEPLLQAGAAAELARRCRCEGIHIAVETAGHVPWSSFELLLPWVDLLYFDLKHIDSGAHRAHTGAPLDLILANLQKASDRTEKLVVRIPVVPGVNATEEILSRMLAFVARETKVRRVELLPFHRLGIGKYDGLGLKYAMAGVDAMSREECFPLVGIGAALGLLVQVS